MRKIAIILKEIAQIENSRHINEQGKAHALAPLKRELDEATGQKSLDEPKPPEPQAKQPK